MSADVWLETSCGDGERMEIEGTSRHLTYNLSPMLRAAGFPGWRDLIGMTGETAAPMLRSVVAELSANPVKYEAMNPANGWGTYEDARKVIGEMAVDCARHPEATYGGWL